MSNYKSAAETVYVRMLAAIRHEGVAAEWESIDVDIRNQVLRPRWCRLIAMALQDAADAAVEAEHAAEAIIISRITEKLATLRMLQEADREMTQRLVRQRNDALTENARLSTENTRLRQRLYALESGANTKTWKLGDV